MKVWYTVTAGYEMGIMNTFDSYEKARAFYESCVSEPRCRARLVQHFDCVCLAEHDRRPAHPSGDQQEERGK